MKKHSYGQLISMSWRWMLQMLFRPFSLKKWIMLTIILFLAGHMAGGFNFNIQGNRANLEKIIDAIKQRTPVQTEVPAPFEAPNISKETEILTQPQDIMPQSDFRSRLSSIFTEPKTRLILTSVIIPLLLFVGLIVLLWMWVSANFSFVFVDSIMRNDASLRVPYHRNKVQGNSYFQWNIVYSSIVVLILCVIISIPIVQLIKAGVFQVKPPISANQILSIVLRHVTILLAAALIFFLIALLVRDFVLPIMYKRKIGILKAWGVFLGLFKRNKGEILLYLLVRLGLSILAFITSILLFILGIITFFLVGGLLGLLGWLIYTITPKPAKPIVLICLIVVGIPTFGFLGFLFNLIFLPIPVFFRIFSIHVLGSIDESLDLFAPKTPKEIAAEGDDEKYKKSMKLIWFTVLAPILVVLLALLLAIAIPNLARIKGKRGVGIEGIEPFKKIRAIQKTSGEIVAPSGKGVKVYLKNGNTFTAEIERETEHNIAFRIEGGTFILPRSDILRIE